MKTKGKEYEAVKLANAAPGLLQALQSAYVALGQVRRYGLEGATDELNKYMEEAAKNAGQAIKAAIK